MPYQMVVDMDGVISDFDKEHKRLEVEKGSAIHRPDLVVDFRVLDVVDGVYDGFNSMSSATLIPIYLLKWTSYSIFSYTSYFYPILYSIVSLLILINI